MGTDTLPFCQLTLKVLNPRNPNALVTIGDHLRKRRLDLGLSRRQVAERIGVE